MTDNLGRKKGLTDSLDGANYDGQSRQEARFHGQSRLKTTMTDSFGKKKRVHGQSRLKTTMKGSLGRKQEFMDSLD